MNEPAIPDNLREQEGSIGGTWSFFVPGDPKTQGSKVTFVGKDGCAVSKESTKGLHRWRKAVADAATMYMLGEKPRIHKAASVHLTLDFRIAKPKSSKRAAPQSGNDGDIDKLVRAVNDALTGVAWHDDGQVVSLKAEKRWAGDSGPGVFVTVQEV